MMLTVSPVGNMLQSDEKKKVLNRIKRINGQVEAVGRMIDDRNTVLTC